MICWGRWRVLTFLPSPHRLGLLLDAGPGLYLALWWREVWIYRADEVRG